MSEIVTTRRPFIDGAFRDGEGEPIVVCSPASTAEVAVVEGASAAQVGSAIAAARGAFDSGPWPRSTAAERLATVRRFADALETRRRELVETVIAEAGCPRFVSDYAQVGLALSSIRELCDLYERLPEWEYNELPLESHFAGPSVRLSIRRYEAAGVVAAITPYNFPFITNIWKVVPSLLAGCTVVLRPSPLTPLEAIVLGDAALEAGLPAGALNVVPEVNSAGAILLTTDPRVDVISFTGSTAVGRAVAAQGATTLKRCILELGGKSVALHLPDSVERSIDGVVGAAMLLYTSHSGQGCAVQSRILVPEARRADVVEALAAAVKNLKIGDPSEATTVIGPLITEAQRQRVDDLVRRSVAEGAVLAAGGRAPAGLDTGWYYEPTVLDAPDPTNTANQHEFFGPVASVIGYRDLDDAVGIANSTQYGLSGGVYTSDLTLGLRIAERIRSGTVQVNTSLAAGFTPMGGFKQSGYGRERGAAGIRSFQELKHVVVGSR
jgi:aldehyde dehydrogenase (NAD+)